MELKRVIRLDSTKLNRAFFTEEGYLIDTPILTSTGIFEYSNPDGSVRRELRLPEEVFDEDSLGSYLGKPVIITHDAGLVNKDNVSENEIGTILTKGYRDGENVRAKIVIHDTDSMKESGLKELSLGYNLDLDETPGDWNGQHYDAVQRNIRINHLALVREARAGEMARLNIDSRDKKTKGELTMSNSKKRTGRSDGVLSPEELKKAIEEYKARHPQGEKQDGEEAEKETEVPVPAKAEDAEEPAITPVGAETPAEKKVEEIRDKQEKKDEAPAEGEEAKETIARQDEDIQTLLDIIDTLLAERDFKEGKADEAEEATAEPKAEEEAVAEDCNNTDEEEGFPNFEKKENGDDDDAPIPETTDAEVTTGEVMNADSIDAVVRTRVKIGITAEKLHLDGVENLTLRAAKKAIIKAVRPTVNLDGKSDSYINAFFDMACEDVKARSTKDTNYQRKQMFNGDSKTRSTGTSAADAHRQKMIDRMQNKKKEEK